MDSKKIALWILIIGVGSIVFGAVGFIWWDRGAPPGFKPKIVDVTIEDISYKNRGVRISGMARHDIRIRQKIGSDSWHIFPLVPKDDINNQFIKVMVLSTQSPDSMATIEEMTFEGFARPPGRLITKEVYQAWEAEGYSFEDKIILVQEYKNNLNDQK